MPSLYRDSGVERRDLASNWTRGVDTLDRDSSRDYPLSMEPEYKSRRGREKLQVLRDNDVLIWI